MATSSKEGASNAFDERLERLASRGAPLATVLIDLRPSRQIPKQQPAAEIAAHVSQTDGKRVVNPFEQLRGRRRSGAASGLRAAGESETD